MTDLRDVRPDSVHEAPKKFVNKLPKDYLDRQITVAYGDSVLVYFLHIIFPEKAQTLVAASALRGLLASRRTSRVDLSLSYLKLRFFELEMYAKNNMIAWKELVAVRLRGTRRWCWPASQQHRVDGPGLPRDYLNATPAPDLDSIHSSPFSIQMAGTGKVNKERIKSTKETLIADGKKASGSPDYAWPAA